MMAIDRWVDNIYTHTHKGVLTSHKKEWIMPFAATWMDLEIVILSEVRNRQTSYDTVYVESKKGATNELIYKTYTELQI